MATLIDPHLFCFSYHYQDDSSFNPSWRDWRNQHQQLRSVKKPDDLEKDYIGGIEKYGQAAFNWDARYEEKSLGDTQGLLLYAAVRDEYDFQGLSGLKELKHHLEPIQGAIGQTWLVLTQWQPDNAAETLETLIHDLFDLWGVTSSNTNPQGELMGNQLFSTSLESGQDLVICVAKNAELMTKIVHFRYELQRLFYYQNKIYWSYQQSQKIKENFNKKDFFPRSSEFIGISQFDFKKNQIIKGNITKLRQILYRNMEYLDRHTQNIEAMSLQLQTLKSNLKAYTQRLNRIQTLCQEHLLPSSLTLWSNFAANQATFYQEQIQQDIESLSPGLRVREQHIKTLQVMVEAVQVEHDRHLENLIGAAGVGVGFSSAAAGAWAGKTEPIQTLGISVAWGFASGVLVYLLLWVIRRNR